METTTSQLYDVVMLGRGFRLNVPWEALDRIARDGAGQFIAAVSTDPEGHTLVLQDGQWVERALTAGELNAIEWAEFDRRT